MFHDDASGSHGTRFEDRVEQLAFKLMKTRAKYCPECDSEIVSITQDSERWIALNHARACVASRWHRILRGLER